MIIQAPRKGRIEHEARDTGGVPRWKSSCPDRLAEATRHRQPMAIELNIKYPLRGEAYTRLFSCDPCSLVVAVKRCVHQTRHSCTGRAQK